MNESAHPRARSTAAGASGGKAPASRGRLGPTLRLLTRHHFSPFKLFVDRPHGTLVVLNPKVGTQTLRTGLARGVCQFRGWADPSQGRYRLWRNAREFPCAPLRDYWDALRNPGSYASFCFVRNPYARVRSAWLDKLAFGHQAAYPRSIRRGVLGPLRRFARSQHLPGGEPGSPIPFPTFLAYIEAEPAGRRDHHWDEQHAVLLMDDIHYERVFRLETQFREGLAHILARIRFPESWADQLVSLPRNESAKPTEPVLTAELARRIHVIYVRDFATLGYDEASWHGL